jgi:hypothetical protein
MANLFGLVNSLADYFSMVTEPVHLCRLYLSLVDLLVQLTQLKRLIFLVNFLYIMYFDYLLEPLPPLYELARPDRWKFGTMLLCNVLYL